MLLDQLKHFFSQIGKANVLRVFLLGVCSGFPWVLIGSAMTGWLTDAGLTRTAIGAFGLIFFVYAFNFLWAPLLDRFAVLPLRICSQRKSWILFLLLLMAGLCYVLSVLTPQTDLGYLGVVALGIAISSATMDIAIDAYRVEHASGEDVPIAAAMATSGWWTGYSVLGFFAFYLKGETNYNWAEIFALMSLFCLFMAMLVLLMVKERSSFRQQIYQQQEQHESGPLLLARIKYTLLLPFADLIKRHGLQVILLLLAFLFTFKMGEAFLGRMSITFYKEVGFTDTQIAQYSKMVTWFVTIIFSLLGAYLNVRLGVFKGLFIGGITMAGTNLLFALIAKIGPNETAFLVAVILDGFTSAFATVVLVSFVTHLTSKTFSATQYALLASIANFGRTTVSSGSGWVVDLLAGDWAVFFVLTTVMVIPSLVILYILQGKLLKQSKSKE